MFYDVFANLCKIRGISPSKAAQACNINKSNVSNWKNKGYVPRGEALSNLAKYFNVSVDYLLGNQSKETLATKDGNEREHDKLVEEAIRLMDGLSPEDRALAVRFLSTLHDSAKSEDK